MVEYVGQHHIAVLLATRAPRPFDSKTYWHARRIHYFASERREREFLLSIYIQNTRKSFIMSGNFFHRSVKKDTNFPVANSSATLTLEPIALWILTHNFYSCDSKICFSRTKHRMGKTEDRPGRQEKRFFWAATNNSRALCSPYVALMCNRDFCVSREVSTISPVSQKTLSLANLRLRSGSATLCKYWLILTK